MRHAYAIIISVIWWAWSGCISAEALVTNKNEKSERKLLIAVIDQVTWHDLASPEASTPTLQGLMNKGAVGMMCVRTAHGWGPEGGYLTLGAGARAKSSWPVGTPGRLEGWAFDVGEKVNGLTAARLFRNYTGWKADANTIVHLGMGGLIRQNATTSYPIRLGLLGETLQRSGIRVACVGNADTPKSVHREIVALGMDEKGRVPLGKVGEDLDILDPGLPYHLTTNKARLLAVLDRAVATANLVILELGETTRLADYEELMLPQASRTWRLRAIEKADRLLGQALAQLRGKGWGVLVLTPTARPAAPEEQFAALTPVIFSAPGGIQGLLTSPSTRRPGIIVNTDIAATVFEHFGISTPADTVGRAMSISPVKGESLKSLLSDVRRQDELETSRRPIFRGYAIFTIIGLWLSALILLLRERAPRWARLLMRAWMLFALAIPSAMLLVVVKPLPLSKLTAVALAIALLLALIGSLIARGQSAHGISMLATTGLLVYDLMAGQRLLAWSPLSYSATAGSRFYGIGNEYAGCLLTSALLGAAVILPARERGWALRFLVAVALLGIAFLVGHPQYGANLGMALACAVGFAVFTLYLWRARPGWTNLLLVMIIAFGVVGTAIMGDILVKGPQASHIGMFINIAKSEGWRALAEVTARKWAMNWQLLQNSIWTYVAIAALGVFGVVILARIPVAISARQKHSWLTPALIACVFGAASAFAFNDSGIVAAAFILLFGAGALSQTVLAEA